MKNEVSITIMKIVTQGRGQKLYDLQGIYFYSYCKSFFVNFTVASIFDFLSVQFWPAWDVTVKDSKTGPKKKSGPEPFLNCLRPLSVSLGTNDFLEHVIPTVKTAATSGTTKVVTFFCRAAITMTF